MSQQMSEFLNVSPGRARGMYDAKPASQPTNEFMGAQMPRGRTFAATTPEGLDPSTSIKPPDSNTFSQVISPGIHRD